MNLAVDSNAARKPFPLWGTCQDFQEPIQLGSGAVEPSIMNRTSGTEGLLVPLDFTGAGRASSRIMANASASVVNALSSLPITVNLHSFGVYTSVVEALHGFFEVVASNTDDAGTKNDCDPFTVHGEKNSFEWDQGRSPRSTDSKQAGAVFRW